MSNSPNTLHIAIIGAGPAGLVLALLLRHFQSQSSSPSPPIKITLYESDPTPSYRSQGGTLDLHPSTGQLALKRCLLYSEFEKHARYDGEALKVMDKNMKVYLSASGGTKERSNGRPEIDRAELRRILVEGFEGTAGKGGEGKGGRKEGVRWGVRITGVEDVGGEEEEGKWNILLKDGSKEGPFDLVVGADGAWSHVRSHLSDAKPTFTGLGGFSSVIRNVHETYPSIADLAARGSVFSFSDGLGLTLQQKGDGDMSVAAWCHRSEDWQTNSGFDVYDPDAVKKHLEEQFQGWKHPLGLAPLVTDPAEYKPQSLYALPVGHRWAHRKGLTLIGDAAHLTTPFAGEGVNLAMTDAMELADAIISGLNNKEAEKQDIHRNIRGFEEAMFKRAKPIQALSVRQGELMFFTRGGLRVVIAEWIRNALGGPYFDSWWLRLLLPEWLVLGFLRVVMWW